MRPILLLAFVVACTSDSFTGADSGGDSAPADSAGSGDGATADASTGCWPFTPSNFDPCSASFDQQYPSMGPLLVTAPTTLNTDTDALPYTGNVGLFRFTSLSVQINTTLTITGSRPALIMVEGDVNIIGTIVVQPTQTSDSSCTPNSGGNVAANCSPGGGGGGFGGAGGQGGACVGTPAGGGLVGSPDLMPLHAGCHGGASGNAAPNNNLIMTGVGGGAGGGALEISARGSITVGNSGAIFASGNGGGGGAAQASNAGTCSTYGGSHDCNTGGGGGGSGGAILLEAPAVSVAGMVCAVGGGGGSGGTGGNSGLAQGKSGAAGAQSCAAALGAATPTVAAGGAGGALTPAGAGVDGAPGGYRSGGGGGGGVGRIRLRSVSQALVSTGPVVPAPYTN